jgi:hypothetical protein
MVNECNIICGVSDMIQNIFDYIIVMTAMVGMNIVGNDPFDHIIHLNLHLKREG